MAVVTGSAAGFIKKIMMAVGTRHFAVVQMLERNRQLGRLHTCVMATGMNDICQARQGQGTRKNGHKPGAPCPSGNLSSTRTSAMTNNDNTEP